MKRVSNTFIKPSRIHGLGLFAKEGIYKGHLVIQGLADFTYHKEWIKYVKEFKERSFCYNNGYCMINHSITPNVHRVGKNLTIIASRYIRKGEEITEDYYKLPDEQNPFLGLNIEEMVYLSKNSKR